MNPWDNDPIWRSYLSAYQREADEEKKAAIAREGNQYLMRKYWRQPMLLSTELLSPSSVMVQPGVAQGTLL